MEIQKTVSIVIPSLNEEQYIAQCLDSIVQTDYPKELLSVFVCDGQSSDHTVEIIREYESRHPFIHYLVNKEKFTPQGLNLGIRASSADVIIILGAHASVSKDFISENLFHLFQSEDTGCAGGVIEHVPVNAVSQVISMAMSSPFGVGNAKFRTSGTEGFTDTVAFGAYKKIVFEKAGLFDEQLVRNQDDEFNFRIRKLGFKIYFTPKIRSKYFVRASFSKLFRQYFQYGYWKVFVNRKLNTITTMRQVVPALFVLALACFIPFSFFSSVAAWILFYMMALYFLFAIMFASNKSRNIFKMVGVIFAFLILHLSYGMGYLKGILDFLLLKKNPSGSLAQTTR